MTDSDNTPKRRKMQIASDDEDENDNANTPTEAGVAAKVKVTTNVSGAPTNTPIHHPVGVHTTPPPTGIHTVTAVPLVPSSTPGGQVAKNEPPSSVKSITAGQNGNNKVATPTLKKEATPQPQGATNTTPRQGNSNNVEVKVERNVKNEKTSNAKPVTPATTANAKSGGAAGAPVKGNSTTAAQKAVKEEGKEIKNDPKKRKRSDTITNSAVEQNVQSKKSRTEDVKKDPQQPPKPSNTNNKKNVKKYEDEDDDEDEDEDEIEESDETADDDDDEYSEKKPQRKKLTPKKKTPAKKKTPTKKTPTKSAATTTTTSTTTPKKTKKEEQQSETDEDVSPADDSDSSGSDDSDSEEKKPLKKQRTSPAKKQEKSPTKKSVKTEKSPKKTKTEKSDTEKSDDGKKRKRAKKGEGKKKEEEEEEGRKWWEEDDKWKVGKKQNWKWRSLQHTGIYFTPEYEPHGIKMLYDGEEVDLTPEQEEWATYYARYLETDHVKKPVFSENFWKDWKTILGKGHVIKDIAKCDFRPIHKYVKAEQEKRKNRTKEEKEEEKKQKAEIKKKYGFAMVDGFKEAIGNFTVEPPGLFLGRGQHPKAGMFKYRVYPEQVTINLSDNAPVPPCPVTGHKWGTIVHNHEVTWLASWRENVNNQNKYVLFSAQSSLRGRSDRSKFETAKKLKSHIKKIRKDYMKNLTNKEDSAVRQRATAMWVIDRLALRVGNDKGKDEADTVGCCSLRCEHVKLHDPNQVEFDFFGKDSMRYHNQVEVISEVFKNFKLFMKGKSPGDKIFDRLNPPQLNAHLQSLMDGLTAKVFRTYNASSTMQQELAKYDDKDASVEEKVLFFNSCSVQVAILCNHQRSVSKTHATQMEKIDDLVKETKDEIKELKVHLKLLNDGKEPKARKPNKDGEERKPFSTNKDVCERKIIALQDKIKKLSIKKKEKDTLKEVSTSTSKVNYIDPRISLAWCKKNGVDMKKIFAKTMRNKFAWAIAEIESEPDFEF